MTSTLLTSTVQPEKARRLPALGRITEASSPNPERLREDGAEHFATAEWVGTVERIAQFEVRIVPQ